MLKTLFLVALIVCSPSLFAQIQVSKLVGKNSSNYTLGYGGFLKFSLPVSDAAYATIEGGANIFFEKDNTDYGIASVPIKLGYRYTLDQSGTGFYLEPQAGYNVAGVDANDDKFTGPVFAGTFGYLFQPAGKIQFDLGLIFESDLHKGGAYNFVGLRLSHNFTFGRRNDY